MKFSCPGMRSILPASFGSQKLCITSSVRRFSRTALLAGNTSSFDVTIPYWGYSKTQKNLFPVTLTVMASSTADLSKLSFFNISVSLGSGTRLNSTIPCRVGIARITNITDENKINDVSILGFPWVCGGISLASSSSFTRYFHNTKRRHPPTAQKRKMVIHTESMKTSY